MRLNLNDKYTCSYIEFIFLNNVHDYVNLQTKQNKFAGVINARAVLMRLHYIATPMLPKTFIHQMTSVHFKHANGFGSKLPPR